MLNIVAVGISYLTAPVEIRERISFNESSTGSGLSELRSMEPIEECVILSTCNRVEFYAVTSHVEPCIEAIKDFIASFHGVDTRLFTSHLYSFSGIQAAKHIFRVASSLDSMVIGEPQILGQVKEAYKKAHEAGATGYITNRLFHYAFSVAKRVRSETDIGSQAVSISSAAVELAKRIFEDLSRRTALLIGTGEMGELAAKHLIKAGTKELVIAGRTAGTAAELAGRLGGTAIKIEEVHYTLKNVDVLITATGSPEFIIKKHHIKEALKLRKNEPMFMIDIAVPRDIDPRVGELENVYLYDIDDLKGVLEENVNTRRKRAVEAEAIVERGVVQFEKWLEGLKVVPTIISLRRRFEAITSVEVEKALGRLGGDSGEVGEKERRVIEGMAAGIIGKILHHPIKNLKREASTSIGAFYSSSVKELFELDSQLELFDDEDDEAHG